MLTLIEKIIFVLLALASAYAAYRSADRIIKVIKRGTGSLGTEKLAQRAVDAALIALTQRTVFKRRLLASIAHAFVVWGFTYSLLVNIGDGLQGFFPGFVFLGEGIIGNLYRLAADLLSVGVLVGMASLLVRRLAVGPKVFGYRDYFSPAECGELEAIIDTELDPTLGYSSQDIRKKTEAGAA